MFISKPALTFVVGVTGHRSARLKADHYDRITQQLTNVFRSIDEACHAELERHRNRYAAPAPRLHLVSGLADGADALAVRLRPLGWTAVGVLPCPEEAYPTVLANTAPPAHAKAAVEEFVAARQEAAHVISLPELRSTDTSGLIRARNLLLRQIDLLVAVWDGHPEQHPGGTTDVIAHALEAGIPVVWIASETQQKPWLISKLGDSRRNSPAADATSGPLAEAVRHELGVKGRRAPDPKAHGTHPKGACASDHLSDFLNEQIPVRSRSMVYEWTRIGPRPWRWRFTKPLGSLQNAAESWRSFLATVPDGGGFKKRLEDILLPRFVAADALATYYSHRYRSAYILAYLLSVCAVTAALLGLVIYSGNHDHAVPGGKICLAFIELFLIFLIIAIVRRGRTRRWQDRWLDYRALAETLRHLRFLGLLGQYEKRGYLESAARPSAGWMLWYLRATMRELGMPSGDFGPEYQRKVLTATLSEELALVDYHADNAEVLRHLHHSLHFWGDMCFIGTLLVLVGFLGAWILTKTGPIPPACLAHASPVIAAITAFLPALGAAFAGIRFTGDFEGFAERSAQTGSELALLRQRYELALDRLDFDVSAEVVFESARVMAADIQGWTTLYSRKELTLPA